MNDTSYPVKLVGYSEVLHTLRPAECWKAIQSLHQDCEYRTLARTTPRDEQLRWMAGCLDSVGISAQCYFVVAGLERLAWLQLASTNSNDFAIFWRTLLTRNILMSDPDGLRVLEIDQTETNFIAYLVDWALLLPE